MKKILRDHIWFYSLFMILILIGTIHLLTSTKGDLVIWFSNHRSPFFDFFFRNATHIGEGIVIIPVMVILLCVRFRFALFAGLSLGISSLLTQLLKQEVFETSPRPVKYFPNIDLHLVNGVKMMNDHSFPSGHTAAAFSLMFALAMITKNKWLQVIFCLLAFACALSRVYLAEHFVEDIYAASILAVILTSGLYLLFAPHGNSKTKWLDRSLLNIWTSR